MSGTNIRLQFAEVQQHLPEHPMKQMFAVRAVVELQCPADPEMKIVDDLLLIFPESLYLLTQKALILYHQRGVVFILHA
jgi:anaphase-promoting complex subunit 8